MSRNPQQSLTACDHPEEDTIPPMPNPILDFPVANLSDFVTEVILDKIHAEDDPLDVVQPFYCVYHHSTAFSSSPNLSNPSPPPADILLPQTVKVEEAYFGKSLNKAVEKSGISRISFFQWHYSGPYTIHML